MSAQIKKVVIQIGKKEIELTVDEAKALKESLDGMFQKAEVVQVPVVVPAPYPVYPVPYRTWPAWYEVICGGTGTATWSATTKDETQILAINMAS